MAWDTPIKIGTNLDLGSTIDTLIKKNISNINTCFIAKVIKINDNKVNVIDLTKPNDKAENPLIYNCLVAIPFTQDLKINIKISVDDIGLCFVTKQDTTHFKNEGKEGVANTKRLFSISDSIFMPLSLYNSNIENNIFDTKSSLECKIENDFIVNAKNDINIKSKNPIVVGNDKGTLSDVVDNIVQLMDLIASGMTGAGTNPSAYNGGKNAIIEKIKQIVG